MTKKLIIWLVAASLAAALFSPLASRSAKAAEYGIPFTVVFDANAWNGHIGTTYGPSETSKTLTFSVFAMPEECARTEVFRDGYKFLGWYTEAEGGVKISQDYIDNNEGGNTERVYAHWAKIGAEETSLTIDGATGIVLLEESTPGHNWVYESVETNKESWATWLTPSSIGSSGTASVSVKKNTTLGDPREVVITLKDQYDNSFSFRITQETPYRQEYNRINSMFREGGKLDGNPNPKFFNIVGKNQKTTYNFGYAILFRVPDGSCCTDSAMMDLLNRRLARDGYLASECFFDIRDVVRGIAINDANYSGMTVTNTITPKGSKASMMNYIPWNRGGEKCNLYNFSNRPQYATYVNEFGTSGEYTPKTYTVVYEKPKNPRERVIELLKEHPEGVFLYARYPGSAHAIVVTGISENGTLQYVDNGSQGAPICSFSKTWIQEKLGSESTLFANVISIGYVR